MKNVVVILFLALGLSLSAQSTFYLDHAGRDEVANALFLENYEIDGSRVDVTLVRARNHAAFLALLAELDLPHPPTTTHPGVMLYLRSDRNPRQKQPTRRGQVRLRGACLVGASESELTIYVFHNIKTRNRYQKIVRHVLGHVKGE
ncbi:MAG: hypothetical protein IJ789_07770 [Bacteroidales bacterium]|nr:hypothetical protein [Bacteroidales bacterium]